MSRGKAKTQERAAAGRKGHRRARAGSKGHRRARGGGKGHKVTSAGGQGHKGTVAGGQGPGAVLGGSARRGFPVFESIGQAAAVLGAPAALLKAAKRQGCKAFISGSRVDAGLLLPFLFEMLTHGNDLPAGMASAAEWLTTEKAKRESIKRQADEHSMMPAAEGRRQAADAGSFIFSELERAERELPPALAGGTAVDIFKRLHAFTEALRKTAKAKFDAIGNEHS